MEAGVTPQIDLGDGPLQGAYRVGFWNDPQPKANSDAAKTYRDDIGFYISCDQILLKENTDPQDRTKHIPEKLASVLMDILKKK